MLAYSRGSNCLAGAAPLEHRVPAVVGSFCPNLDIAQWVEQQPDKLSVAGSTPVIPPCNNSEQQLRRRFRFHVGTGFGRLRPSWQRMFSSEPRLKL